MLSLCKSTCMLCWYLFARDSEELSGPDTGVVKAPEEGAIKAETGSNSVRVKQIEHA